MRPIAWAVLGAAAVLGGCTSVPLDYTAGVLSDAAADSGTPTGDAGAPDGASHADAMGADSSEASAATDSGEPDASHPPDDAGTGPACPCDPTTATYCCVPGNMEPAFCSSNATACAGSNGIFLGCQSYDPQTESECCWNSIPGGGMTTAYAAACGTRATSCLLPSDCTDKPCQTTTCNGVLIGACGVAPTCP